MIDTFFKKFELFANAPGAVGKMRELVLELAVQGRLVDQRHSDGSAKQLLAAVSREREALVSTFRIPEVLSSSESSHEPTIPANWAWTTLGSISLQIQYGYTASADPNATKIRMLRITDIQDGRVDWKSVPGCHIAPDEVGRYLLRANDILIARTGGTIGKSFMVTNAPIKSVFASYLIRVTPPRSLEARYLKLFLESPLYWTQLSEMSAGTGQPNVNGQALGRLRVPLPPLAEQKRIVAKVDELMALCDRLEAQLKARDEKHAAVARASLARFSAEPTAANLNLLFHRSYSISPDELRKTILMMAIQGRLVPQDPRDETASCLLAQVTRKKLAMIAAKAIRPGKVSRPHSALAAPTVPPSWAWVNLDTLCFKVTDGTHFTPRYTSSGIRFVSAKDIVNGTLVFDRCKFISQEEHDQLYRRCNPEYHDIVISKSGSIGSVALVEDRDEFSLFESLALLKFDQTSICSRFLVYALTHACSSLTAGHIRGVGVKHLHLDILRGLELALPPLAEQRRIVAKVDQLMALVDQLEQQLTASRATAEKLLDAVVAELTAA